MQDGFINQEVTIYCSDEKCITGKVISASDKDGSIELLISDGDSIRLNESVIEEIRIVPEGDTYTSQELLGGEPVRIEGFYEDRITGRVWHVDLAEQIIGPILFTFDRKKIYNYWSDYPQNLTPEEIRIFEEDCPYWENFSKERKKKAKEILKKG